MKSRLLAVVVLVWATACSEGIGPGSHLDRLSGLIVSPPIAGSAASLSPGMFGSAHLGGSSLVYVSLVPGSAPTGLRAVIHDQATGVSVSTAVVDGGFDPIAIPANIGDTLIVEIRGRDSTSVRGFDMVRAIRPPVIVRTYPPKGGRDVPLNAPMVIVFSTPIDTTTLTTESIQLWRGTTLVAGAVRLSDVAGIRAELHPDSLLAGQTDYRLVVTHGIRDVNGVVLDSSVTVSFTTGSTPPATGLVFASVSARNIHTCGLTTGGAAYCWGWSLGVGVSVSPVLVAGGVSFAAVAVGDYHGCGRTAAGAAYCWGDNEYGQLGNGETIPRGNPGLVADSLSFTAISVGGFHNCGVTLARNAYCWGFNSGGQLGDGTTTDRSSPVLVAGGRLFAAVSAGTVHTCGITVEGAAYCWGANANGKLGDGTATDRSSPVPVAGGVSFVAVSAGEYDTCGLTAAGAAYCWGSNFSGQLGDGTTTDRSTPGLVAGGLSFAAVSAGATHTCGVTVAGAVYCWGAGGRGEDTAIPRLTPELVAGGLSFAAASAGNAYSCGVTTAGTAYCWGSNYIGQLGDGTMTDSNVPVKVAGQP